MRSADSSPWLVGALFVAVGAGLLVRPARGEDAAPPAVSPPPAAAPPAASPPPAAPAWPKEVTAFLDGWAEPVGDAKEATTGFPRRVRRTKDGMEMALVPAGTFPLGAVPDDGRALADEKPRHPVTLTKAYYVDVSEVTVGMWRAYVAAKAATMPTLQDDATDAHPMHNVAWDDARAYLAWAGASLPTEAQWERAARGGRDDAVFPWGAADDVKQRNGALDSDGFAGLAPVKSFPANDYGLYDVVGNVEEWCADVYGEGTYTAEPATDPTGPATGTTHVVRGGCAQSLRPALRVSSRGLGGPDIDPINVGLRGVRSLP